MNLKNNKVYTCDKCDTKMSLYDLGYLGDPLSKKKYRKTRRKNIIKRTECLCHNCYHEKLDSLGKNPNTI